GYAEGDRVVLSFRACRTCRNCTGLGVGYCENTVLLNYMGYRLDGSTTLTEGDAPVQASFFGQSSFARHAIVSPDNAVRVDPDADLTRLGPFGCAFQTGAGAVLNVLQPGAHDAVVVYGVGAVGLAAIATARAQGVATVVAVDLKPERLDAAASLGATTVNPSELGDTGLPDRIRELTGGGASHAVDTTGVGPVIRDGALALRPRGTLVVLGLGAPEITFDAIDIMMNGKVVRGSVEGDSDPHATIPALIRMAQDGSFPVDQFISTYPFEEINRAAADLLSGAAIKPVLVWE
ncbi:MAG: NAD(P)-dependent alcohol dehydrogenase, partial [Myxococcales bacterium]